MGVFVNESQKKGTEPKKGSLSTVQWISAINMRITKKIEE